MIGKLVGCLTGKIQGQPLANGWVQIILICKMAATCCDAENHWQCLFDQIRTWSLFDHTCSSFRLWHRAFNNFIEFLRMFFLFCDQFIQLNESTLLSVLVTIWSAHIKTIPCRCICARIQVDEETRRTNTYPPLLNPDIFFPTVLWFPVRLVSLFFFFVLFLYIVLFIVHCLSE